MQGCWDPHSTTSTRSAASILHHSASRLLQTTPCIDNSSSRHMSGGEESTGLGDAPRGAGPKRDSKAQGAAIKILHKRAVKLVKDYPSCKLLLLVRSALGTSRDKRWLVDFAHNFGDERQADVMRRQIAKHVAQVWAWQWQRGAAVGRRTSGGTAACHKLLQRAGRPAGTVGLLTRNQNSWALVAGGWQGPGL